MFSVNRSLLVECSPRSCLIYHNNSYIFNCSCNFKILSFLDHVILYHCFLMFLSLIIISVGLTQYTYQNMFKVYLKKLRHFTNRNVFYTARHDVYVGGRLRKFIRSSRVVVRKFIGLFRVWVKCRLK